MDQSQYVGTRYYLAMALARAVDRYVASVRAEGEDFPYPPPVVDRAKERELIEFYADGLDALDVAYVAMFRPLFGVRVAPMATVEG